MDKAFHALSDKSRRRLVEYLSEQPATVTELAELLPIARPGVSRHLRVLRDAGLVRVTTSAQYRTYHLVPAPLEELAVWLQIRGERWTTRLDALQTEVARGKREAVRTNNPKEMDAS